MSPSSILTQNKVTRLRPGQSLNIYQPVETPEANTFNRTQQSAAVDRRDKRAYNPQGIGGIRPDTYTPGNLPYQEYRLNWFAEQGILPLTVNTWVADELGYTDLLKEFGYRLNSDLDRWERPAVFPWETGKKSSSGGSSRRSYGGGGGYRRGGGGGGIH